jgi:hypothetical protein
MVKTTIVFLFSILLSVFSTLSQTVYSGHIDKYPVEFVIQPGYEYSDSQMYEGAYRYKKFNDPIYLSGAFKQKMLRLNEPGRAEKPSAILSFINFNNQADSINGEWRNVKTGKKLKIQLKRMYEFKKDYDSSNAFKNRELLQAVSLNKYYFKIVVSKTKDGVISVDGLKLYSKKNK